MIITGAKGMAKELLEILSVDMKMGDDDIIFFDNIHSHNNMLYNRFRILKSFEDVKAYFHKNQKTFTLGLGNPDLRSIMATKFMEIGGEMVSIISSDAKIGSFNTLIGKGSQIMQGVVITNDVQLGKGVLVNLNATISHDCIVGDYSEIACNASISGRCKIGKEVMIGSNATILPDVVIGDNAIIGAGAVVVKDVQKNTTVVGNPAKMIKLNG